MASMLPLSINRHLLLQCYICGSSLALTDCFAFLQNRAYLYFTGSFYSFGAFLWLLYYQNSLLMDWGILGDTYLFTHEYWLCNQKPLLYYFFIFSTLGLLRKNKLFLIREISGDGDGDGSGSGREIAT